MWLPLQMELSFWKTKFRSGAYFILDRILYPPRSCTMNLQYLFSDFKSLMKKTFLMEEEGAQSPSYGSSLDLELSNMVTTRDVWLASTEMWLVWVEMCRPCRAYTRFQRVSMKKKKRKKM